MQYAFYAFIFAILIWFLGIGVAYYHVKKYKIPGDNSQKAFWAFFIIAGLSFLWVIYFVTDAVWGA